MKIILFSHNESGERGKVLVQHVSDSFGLQRVTHLRNTNALKYHLKQRSHPFDQELFVLLAETPERLEELICFSDLLEDRRIILVVPDNEPATLSRAQQLFPRFFTSLSDSYADLCSVVDQMIRNRAASYYVPLLD